MEHDEANFVLRTGFCPPPVSSSSPLAVETMVHTPITLGLSPVAFDLPAVSICRYLSRWRQLPFVYSTSHTPENLHCLPSLIEQANRRRQYLLLRHRCILDAFQVNTMNPDQHADNQANSVRSSLWLSTKPSVNQIKPRRVTLPENCTSTTRESHCKGDWWSRCTKDRKRSEVTQHSGMSA